MNKDSKTILESDLAELVKQMKSFEVTFNTSQQFLDNSIQDMLSVMGIIEDMQESLIKCEKKLVTYIKQKF